MILKMLFGVWWQKARGGRERVSCLVRALSYSLLLRSGMPRFAVDASQSRQCVASRDNVKCASTRREAHMVQRRHSE